MLTKTAEIHENIGYERDEMNTDIHCRSYSWEHCYNAFKIIKEKEEPDDDTLDRLSLHLAFYLASMGMYRGSSGLIWKDYKIHKEAIQCICKHSNLYGDHEINVEYIKEVCDIYDELSKIYSKIEYHKPGVTNEKSLTITSTATLISKILLGTLGCMPALDTYFILGAGKEKKLINADNTLNFMRYKEFIMDNNILGDLSSWQYDEFKDYPRMRILDMYLWRKGFNKENNL